MAASASPGGPPLRAPQPADHAPSWVRGHPACPQQRSRMCQMLRWPRACSSPKLGMGRWRGTPASTSSPLPKVTRNWKVQRDNCKARGRTGRGDGTRCQPHCQHHLQPFGSITAATQHPALASAPPLCSGGSSSCPTRAPQNHSTSSTPQTTVPSARGWQGPLGPSAPTPAATQSRPCPGLCPGPRPPHDGCSAGLALLRVLCLCVPCCMLCQTCRSYPDQGQC